MERRTARMIHAMTMGGTVRFSGTAGQWEPAVDMFETNDQVVVYVDVSGVTPDSLAVTVDQDRLTVRGQRRFPEREVVCVHQLEIDYGPFQRTVRLPVPVEVETASSVCRHGLLIVRLPKARPQGKVIIQVD